MIHAKTLVDIILLNSDYASRCLTVLVGNNINTHSSSTLTKTHKHERKCRGEEKLTVVRKLIEESVGVKLEQ